MHNISINKFLDLPGTWFLEKGKILHLRVLRLSFVKEMMSVYLPRLTAHSWRAPCRTELLWEWWGTAGVAGRISGSMLGFI